MSPRSGGFILWFTGLSGVGKSTLARALRDRLEPQHPVEILDGDALRASLSPRLGVTRPEREEHLRRVGYFARRLAHHGVAVIAATLSPYQASRDEVRRLAAEAGLPFVEVYVHAPLEVLVRRDVKGLYRKALAGELAHFTGISDVYEPPPSPELSLPTEEEPVERCVERLLAMLRERGLTACA